MDPVGIAVSFLFTPKIDMMDGMIMPHDWQRGLILQRTFFVQTSTKLYKGAELRQIVGIVWTKQSVHIILYKRFACSWRARTVSTPTARLMHCSMYENTAKEIKRVASWWLSKQYLKTIG